jgi:hypothetical protein
MLENSEYRIANSEWVKPEVAAPRAQRALFISLFAIRYSLFIALAMLVPGCIQMAEAYANIAGGDWIKPEFELTKEPLLILVDDRSGQVTEPKALREVHQTLSENFLEFKVNKRVIPFQELQNLQADRNFARMTVRQIGEKLGAAQVLYIDVERFTLHSEPGAPIFKGEFVVRVKVLSTDRKKDVRLWPEEESGRRVDVTTPAAPTDTDKGPSDVAAELGIKLGQEVARLFYGYREMNK